VPHDLELHVLALDLSIVNIETVVGLHFAEVHEVLHGHAVGVAHWAVIAPLLLAVEARIVVSTDVLKVDLVGHVLQVRDIFVSLLSLATDQAREAHAELVLDGHSVEVSSGEGLALLPASRPVREGR